MLGGEEGKLIEKFIHSLQKRALYFELSTLSLPLAMLTYNPGIQILAEGAKYKAQSTKAQKHKEHSSEIRFAFCHKSFIRLAIIGMLHANSLGLSFTLQRGIQIHVRFAAEQLLGFGECKRRTLRQPFRKFACNLRKLSRGDDTVI